MIFLDPFTYIIIALAAFRLTRFVTTDTIFESIREKIWKKYPPSTKLGYLITCNWCSGFWISIILVIGLILLPVATYVVSLVLSISTIVGLVANKLDN
jgi:hypothetical protein